MLFLKSENRNDRLLSIFLPIDFYRLTTLGMLLTKVTLEAIRVYICFYPIGLVLVALADQMTFAQSKRLNFMFLATTTVSSLSFIIHRPN